MNMSEKSSRLRSLLEQSKMGDSGGSLSSVTDHEYVRPVKLKIRKDSRSRTGKRPRNVMSLSEKMDILNELDGGVSVATLSNYRCLSESTVRYIKKSEDKIKASIKGGAPLISKVTYVSRDPLIERMEKLLTVWVEERGEMDKSPASQIQNKARKIYNQLKVETKANTNFVASRGWFTRYQKRIKLGNAKMLDDTPYTEKFHQQPKNMLRELELEEEEAEDKEESQASDVDEIDENKNLIECSEENQDEMEGLHGEAAKTLQSKTGALIEVIEIASLLQQKVDEVDPVTERRDLFKCILNSAVLPYVKMYNELLEIKQNSPGFLYPLNVSSFASTDLSNIIIKEEKL